MNNETILCAEDFIRSFTSIVKIVQQISKEHGFEENWNDAEKIALMHSELSEALETTRSIRLQYSEHISQFLNLEEELADVIIRIMHFSAYHQLRIAEALIAKVEYNATRPYKHGKKF